MKAILYPLVFAGIFPLVCAAEMPCWDKASCYESQSEEPRISAGFVKDRPPWHKRLDNLRPKMRRDADYSILFNPRRDMGPEIRSTESQRAVDELAGSVMSAIASPLAYRLPLFPEFDLQRRRVNEFLDNAIPEVKAGYYSVHFSLKADFSQTNPVSLDVKFGDGRELGIISVRMRETEIVMPVSKGVHAVGGYSFRDNSWYVYLAGKIPMPW